MNNIGEKQLYKNNLIFLQSMVCTPYFQWNPPPDLGWNGMEWKTLYQIINPKKITLFLGSSRTDKERRALSGPSNCLHSYHHWATQ